MRQTAKGFTMVETILVMGLLATISIAIFSTLSNGLKIWKRGYQSVLEEDLLIFFDKMSHDLHNAVDFTQLPLAGKTDSFTFATIIRTPADAKLSLDNEYVKQIGKVGYYFDAAQKGIFRRQANYSLALENKYNQERLLAVDVRSVKFQYYYRKTKQFQLLPETTAQLPSAVRVTVDFGSTRHPQSMVKLIPIPVGS